MHVGGCIVALCLALAGCSGQPAAASDDPDAAAAGVDVAATARTGVIKGVVVDATIRPIADATVLVEGLATPRTTSQDGTFGFASLAAGTYQILAEKAGFHSARQSVSVRAGEDHPPVIRFQLVPVPSVEPRFDVFHFNAITGLEYCAPIGCYTQPGPWDGLAERQRATHSIEVGPGGVAAQGEFTWQPQTSMAERGNVVCHSRTSAHTVALSAGTSASPAVQRVALRGLVDSKHVAATSATCSWTLADSGLPASLVYEQELAAILHVFYHFEPDSDWRFGRDGDPIGGI